MAANSHGAVFCSPSLTRILQNFEGLGMVRRGVHASDQRRALFALTAKGRKLFDTVAPDSEQLYAGIAAEFGVQKLETLYALLAEFSAALAVGEGES